MARKGGRGGNKAARSAAAKKGWETRRRGGAKAKPAATKRTAASKAKGNEYGTGVVAQRKKAMSARLVAAGKEYGTRNPQQAAYIRAQNINIIGQRLASEGKGNKAARRAAQLATKAKAKAAKAATKRRGGMPKTTSARGRALTNQRRAADLVRASRGGKGPSAKAVRSVLTAQRARAFYAATGGGKKRSAVKAKSAAKIGKSIRAEGRAKATAARAKVAGRPRAGAKPVAQRPAGASLAERKRANALKKGIIRQTTDAERRQRAQNLATAERALANVRANPPRSAFGLDRNAIQMAEARVEGLRRPMPDFRRVDTSSIRQAARDNLAIRRSAKQNAKVMRGMQTARKAAAWYQQTGTLPASMRKKTKRAKPAAQRPAAKLGFTQSDFQRRSQRTAGIRNPRVRETAQRLYGRVLDLGSSPRQLRTMFKKAGKPKAGRKSVAQRQSQREHRDMLALANRLF